MFAEERQGMRRFLIPAVLVVLLAASLAPAMEIMEDTGLSEVSAQTGITINSSNFQGTATSAYWYDSDGYPGDATPGYLSWLGLSAGPISLDMDINAGTDGSRSYLRLDIASMTNLGVGINEVHVGNAVGANASAGSLRSSLDLGPSYLNISGLDAGGTGVRIGGQVNIYGPGNGGDSFLAYGDSDGAVGFAGPGYLTLMGLDASITFDGLKVDAGTDAIYYWLNLDFPATTLLAQATNVTISNVEAGDAAKSLGQVWARADIGSDFYLKIRGGGQSGSGLSMLGDISLVGGTSYLGWYDTNDAAWFGLLGINLTYAATDEFHLDFSQTWVRWRWPEFTADVTVNQVVTGAGANEVLFGLRARIHMPEVEPGQSPTLGNVGMRFYQELEFLADSDIGIADSDGFTTYATSPATTAGWFTLHNLHLYTSGGAAPPLLVLDPVSINVGNGGVVVSIPPIDVRLDVQDLLLGSSFDNGGSNLDSCAGLASRWAMPGITMNITTH